jgi:hypothetical protein
MLAKLFRHYLSISWYFPAVLMCIGFLRDDFLVAVQASLFAAILFFIICFSISVAVLSIHRFRLKNSSEYSKKYENKNDEEVIKELNSF